MSKRKDVEELTISVKEAIDDLRFLGAEPTEVVISTSFFKDILMEHSNIFNAITVPDHVYGVPLSFEVMRPPVTFYVKSEDGTKIMSFTTKSLEWGKPANKEVTDEQQKQG